MAGRKGLPQHPVYGISAEVAAMEHRWGHRLVTSIPVRLRCLQSPDSGCRCLGRLENISASGAMVRTELGICPSPSIAVEALDPAFGLEGRELAACVVRSDRGEMAIEWQELASTGVCALLTESMLTSATSVTPGETPALGRVPFCALAPSAAA